MKDDSSDPRAIDTRARIRRAVLELVEERGIHATRIKDVLERACVARATFYAHFDDKEDALVGGFDLFRLELADADDAGTEASADESPSACEDTPSGARAPLPSLLAIFEHAAHMRPFFESVKSRGELELPMSVARRDLFASYREIFGKLQERGFELACDPESLAHATTAAVNALLIAWLEEGVPGEPVERAELAESLVRRIAGL